VHRADPMRLNKASINRAFEFMAVRDATDYNLEVFTQVMVSENAADFAEACGRRRLQGGAGRARPAPSARRGATHAGLRQARGTLARRSRGEEADVGHAADRALEGHSEHLPHGTDTFVAEELARRVAERVEGALALPAIPYGMSWHYREFPLSLSLSPDTMVRVIVEICESLIENDVRRIVIVKARRQRPGVETAGRILEKKHGVVIAALEEWYFTLRRSFRRTCSDPEPGSRGRCGDVAHPRDQAGARRDGAREGAGEPARLPELHGPRDVRKYAPIGRFYPTGEFPDARGASAEKGNTAFDLLADKIAAFLNRADAF